MRVLLIIVFVAMMVFLVRTLKKCISNNIQIRWHILLVPAVIIAANLIFILLHSLGGN